MPTSGKILVAQGGGPTAVINQSLAGVLLEARRHHNVQRVYGARHGVRGIVDGKHLVLGNKPLAANASLLQGLKPGAKIAIEFIERQPGEWVITRVDPVAVNASAGAPASAAKAHTGH